MDKRGVLAKAGKVAAVAGVTAVGLFAVTFTIYMTNAENKLIYRVVRPLLTKHYDNQNRDRRI